MVWDWRLFEDLEEKGNLINEFISDKGVCRKAPATMGLLQISDVHYKKKSGLAKGAWPSEYGLWFIFIFFKILFCSISLYLAITKTNKKNYLH